MIAQIPSAGNAEKLGSSATFGCGAGIVRNYISQGRLDQVVGLLKQRLKETNVASDIV